MHALGFAHQVPAEISQPIYPNVVLMAKHESAGVGHPVRSVQYPVQLEGQRNDRAQHVTEDFQYVPFHVQEELSRFIYSFFTVS